jgi:4-amino-4-deoxy-L-arabinose transferase-like glycosyltransferase
MNARLALLIILAVTIWRIALLPYGTDLFVDEAQYWFWGQNLDLGYYSKPPVIAWVIRAFTTAAGSDNAFFIRLPGPLFHMGTALVLMTCARRVAGEAHAGWAGVTYITAPAVAFASVYMSTDTLLLFFVAVTLLAYIGLTRRASVGLALLMGVAFGLAFLSKYSALLLIPGGLVALLTIKEARIGRRDFLIAAVAAAAVASPNLIWNMLNDATTVRHTTELAEWRHMHLDIGNALEFFGAQFGVIGPVTFAALLWASAGALRGKAPPWQKILFWLSMPVVALITLQALTGKAYANWAALGYVAGVLLAVWWLGDHWKAGLWIALAINGFATITFPLITVFPDAVRLPNGSPVLKRHLGRSEISLWAADAARKAGLSVIVTDNRDMVADLFHTLRNEPFRLYARAPAGFPGSYYEQRFALPAEQTGEVAYLTRSPLACAATPPQEIAKTTPDHGHFAGKDIYLYRTVPACLPPQ